MTIHWKPVEQYLTVVQFIFQVCSVRNFGKFVNFGLGTVRSESANYDCACFFVFDLQYLFQCLTL